MNIFDKTFISRAHNKLQENGNVVKKRLDKITISPKYEQTDFLLNLIKNNKDTEIGRQKDFESIKTVDEFRKRMPISTYDDYAEAIYRMSEKGESNVITAYPVTHFSIAFESMGNPKRIPYSEKTESINHDYLFAYNYWLLSSIPDHDKSKSLNTIEGMLNTLPSGATIGGFNSKVMSNVMKVLDKIYVPPLEVMIPERIMNFRYLHALYGLREADLSSVLCDDNSYFLEIMRLIENNWRMLADDIEKGTINSSIQVPDDVRIRLCSKMRPDGKRAEELRRVFGNQQNEPLIPLIWPNMKAVIGIGTAEFSAYTEKLRKYCGPKIKFLLEGMITPQGLFSVPIELDSTESVLIPDSIFYEFLPENAHSDDDTVTIEEVEFGKNYELVITNTAGFYRYKTNRIVKITGTFNGTPTVEYLYNSNENINLAGENSNEYVLREAVTKMAEECHIDLTDYCIYANTDVTPARYEFLIEVHNLADNFNATQALDAVTKQLSALNPIFAEKIKEGSIGKSMLHILQEDTYQLYRDMMTMKGASAAQLTPVHNLNNILRKRFFYALIDDRFEK